MPLDDRALAASAGWTRLSGTAYWNRTATRSTQAGRTLARAGVRLDRVGVLAERCPGCGSVGVYVGSTRIGAINLTGTTRYRALFVLPTFGTRVGTVSIRALTNRKPVVIDGLAVSGA